MNLGLKLRGIAGLGEQYGTPPFVPPQTGPMARPMPTGMGQPPAPAKGGFFKEGGMGRVLAGAIGDTLLQQGDMAPIYAPMMQQQRQAQMAEALWQRQRTAKREDQQWEWQNKPKEQRAPIYREDNAGNTIEIDPKTGQTRVLHRETTPKMNFIPDGMGGGRWVPVPMTGAPSAQPGIGTVIPDPRKAGGPASAPGTFPR